MRSSVKTEIHHLANAFLEFLSGFEKSAAVWADKLSPFLYTAETMLRVF
jgi:hypothetical protein